jgi:predicted ATPase
MLKKLILENWKSFRYAELPIDPLTVLIGTNASGKSNVIDALEFLKRTATGKEIQAALAGDSTLPAQAKLKQYEMAQALAEIMVKAADEKTPWAAFTDQSVLWEAEGLRKLAAAWPNLAVQKISIGDATIKTVAEYYARIGFQVEILTGDDGLKAYQPTTPASTPKRWRSG